MEKTNNTFIIIVVAIVVIVGGYFLLRKPEALAPINNNPEPVIVTPENTVFTDKEKTVTFSYPKDLAISSGDIGYSASWRQNTQTLGLSIAKVTIPKSTQPQTNFSEAVFSLGTSNNTLAIKDCLIANNGEIAKGTVSINGVTYTKTMLGDAGAGNYYNTTSYRTMHNNQCYVMEYTIHSTSIGAYSPDQGITEIGRAHV